MKKKKKKVPKPKKKAAAKKKKPVKKAAPKKKKIKKAKAKKTSKVKKAVKSLKKPEKKGELKKPIPVAKPVFKPKTPITVYLGLGSNVGDREEYIEQAVTILRETPGIKVGKRASNYETEAVGGIPQAPYINSAVAITTKLDPYELLSVTQGIEDALGREKGAEWGPRTMDVDILMYSDLVLSDDKLTIPHPLMHERLFVLEPLREIAPVAIHPVLEKTISELFEEKRAEASDTYDDALPGFREIKRGTSDDYEHW
jgi:2-amino-4-hydroxy-6-hydroxymethyldihydropteridine diphosphokinase